MMPITLTPCIYPGIYSVKNGPPFCCDKKTLGMNAKRVLIALEIGYLPAWANNGCHYGSRSEPSRRDSQHQVGFN
jgi:hypothetical protein